MAGGQLRGGHPNVAQLLGGDPGHESGAVGLLDLLGAGQQPGGPADDHAPALGDGVVVGLEKNLFVHHGGEQLGSLAVRNRTVSFWTTKLTGKISS